MITLETPEGYHPIGTRVQTNSFYGSGVIVDYELMVNSTPRYGVKLDKPELWIFSRINPDKLAYFWPADISGVLPL